MDFISQYLFSRLFYFCPKISKQGQTLVARSDWRALTMCLGYGGRMVTIDPVQKVIRLKLRSFWFYQTSKRIEFDWIQEIVYHYNDIAPAWGAHQENDLFEVALLLKNGERVTLFHFYGEGSFVNNGIMPDWMYWEDFMIADYIRGNQESESLMFADMVSRLTGAPIGNSLP